MFHKEKSKKNIPTSLKEGSEGITFHDAMITENESGDMELTIFIDAPGKGDEALKLIGEKLQLMANKHYKTYVHLGIPVVDAAVKLFERTKGYKETKRDSGTIYWKKYFHPQ